MVPSGNKDEFFPRTVNHVRRQEFNRGLCYGPGSAYFIRAVGS
jgi:hypothetical protein